MLDEFFSPHSIAVVGASIESKKLGHQILSNIINSGFPGEIYPVNIDPNIKQILGRTCYTNVLEIPSPVDLAVIVIPAKIVPAIVEQCGRKRIKGLIIISAGFGEVGTEGKKLEEQIKKIAKEFGARILGPNCLGLIDTTIPLNASFAPTTPTPGNVAVISQSGAVCTALLDWATASNIGFSRFYSLGNKADITELDLLLKLADDEKTKVIILYLESIADGKKFKELMPCVTAKKPVIIFKAGITEAGATAIASHTGSLAGSNAAIDALFAQTAVIRAKTLEELFDFAEGFSMLPKISGKKIAIITNAGGPGVMATDALMESNLELAKFESQTTRTLKQFLPPAANIHNPVDVIGDAKADRYEIALKNVLADKNVDGALVLLTPQTATEIEKTAELIIYFSQTQPKPIVSVFMGGKKVALGMKILENKNICVFETPERAVKVFQNLYQYHESKKYFMLPRVGRKINDDQKKIVSALIKGYQEKNQTLIAGPQADEIFKVYKIPTIKSGLATTAAEAENLARAFGFPIVLKISSPDIVHKSDVGGVLVGLKDEKEIKTGFIQILKNIKSKIPKAKADGIMVYEMAPRGEEFFIGAVRDPAFGPLIAFGLGGIYVEVFRDTSFRLSPLKKEDAIFMIESIKSKKLLEGIRGKPKLSKISIIDILLRISELMENHPEISELDINPLIVTTESAVAIDNRIIMKF